MFLAAGLRGFDWAPKGDNVLAYWAPERGQQPARVVMVELPSKREVGDTVSSWCLDWGLRSDGVA